MHYSDSETSIGVVGMEETETTEDKGSENSWDIRMVESSSEEEAETMEIRETSLVKKEVETEGLEWWRHATTA